MKIRELLTEWLENYERERIKPRTYQRYESLIRVHILPKLGDVDINEICRKQIYDFLALKRKNGNLEEEERALSAASTNLILTVLNLAFEYACDMDLTDINPCARLKRAKGRERQIDAYTRDEQIKIERTIADSSDTRLIGVILCLYTGIRIGELLGLEWSDVDFTRGVLSINKAVYRGKSDTGGWQLVIDTPKTNCSVRDIPLPKFLLKLLKMQRKVCKSAYIVENKKGERMSVRSYQYIFESLAARAGVRRLSFHALRHTFATRAVECGMDIKTLSEIMGHKNASVTLNCYAHSMLEHKIRMMQRLPCLYEINVPN